MAKTQDQIRAEVEKLKAIKPKVQHFSLFEDDNWAAIDAQVEVLENDMTEARCYSFWSDEAQMYALDSALEAVAWRDESSDSGWLDSLVESWEELVD